MNRLVLVVLILVAASAPTAAQPETRWYVAAGLGKSNTPVSVADAFGGLSGSECGTGYICRLEDGSAGHTLFAGYRLTRIVAVEAGWADFGKILSASRFDAVDLTADRDAVQQSSSVIWVAARATWQPTRIVGVSGRLGVNRWSSDAGWVSGMTSMPTGFTLLESSDSGYSPTFGLGLHIDPWKHVGFLIDWNRYLDLGKSDSIANLPASGVPMASTAKLDVDFFALSIVGRF